MTQKEGKWSEFRRLDAAKIGFDNIMRSLEHEDSKANRIVVAMAFITAASAVVFTHLHTVGGSWTLATGQTNWVAWFFGIYVGLVLLGTLFLLAALGPRFHIPAG